MSEPPQHLRALSDANRVRVARAQTRNGLRGASPREIVRALVDPPPELAGSRLRPLFGATDRGHNSGLIVRFGPARLERALNRYNESSVCRDITCEHRLCDLTERERRALARAVIAEAPRSWAEGVAA